MSLGLIKLTNFLLEISRDVFKFFIFLHELILQLLIFFLLTQFFKSLFKFSFGFLFLSDCFIELRFKVLFSFLKILNFFFTGIEGGSLIGNLSF